MLDDDDDDDDDDDVYCILKGTVVVSFLFFPFSKLSITLLKFVLPILNNNLSTSFDTVVVAVVALELFLLTDTWNWLSNKIKIIIMVVLLKLKIIV
jgi:hypothetical protein